MKRASEKEAIRKRVRKREKEKERKRERERERESEKERRMPLLMEQFLESELGPFKLSWN